MFVSSSKTILVTGGSGFIGSNLVRLLIQTTGHRVINLDALTYAGNPASTEDISGNERYHFIHGDICDAATVAKILAEHRPDWVMHLAAESHVDRSIDGPGRFIQTNIIGTYQLLQTSLDHYRALPAGNQESFRFLHVSTDEVYGSLSATDESGFSETTPYSPHSPYSASKASSDHLARAWNDTYGLPVLVTNCSNNYGPYQFPEKLIPVVILKCLRGEKIPVYGKGENIRDWLHVGDHCAALLTVMEKGAIGETYNIGGNNELSNLKLVTHICEVLDKLRPGPRPYAELISFVTDRPGHDFRYAVDGSKIQRELGWKPVATFESELRKTIQWYLDHESWWQTILNGSYRLERLGAST